MSKLVPSKPLDVAAAVAQADGLLRIWDVDLETADRGELRQLCGTAAAALQHGQPSALAARIRAIATPEEVVRAIDELLAAFPALRDRTDSRVFARLMAEELTVDKPPAAALRAGVRALIRESAMPPYIADVLAAVGAQKAACESRAVLLDRLGQRVREVAARLAAPKE